MSQIHPLPKVQGSPKATRVFPRGDKLTKFRGPIKAATKREDVLYTEHALLLLFHRISERPGNCVHGRLSYPDVVEKYTVKVISFGRGTSYQFWLKKRIDAVSIPEGRPSPFFLYHHIKTIGENLPTVIVEGKTVFKFLLDIANKPISNGTDGVKLNGNFHVILIGHKRHATHHILSMILHDQEAVGDLLDDPELQIQVSRFLCANIGTGDQKLVKAARFSLGKIFARRDFTKADRRTVLEEMINVLANSESGKLSDEAFLKLVMDSSVQSLFAGLLRSAFGKTKLPKHDWTNAMSLVIPPDVRHFFSDLFTILNSQLTDRTVKKVVLKTRLLSRLGCPRNPPHAFLRRLDKVSREKKLVTEKRIPHRKVVTINYISSYIQ